MKKVIILCMLLALSFSTYSCGGGGAGSSSTPPGENPGTPSIVKLMPSHYVAQTNSFISLHVKVLDGNGKPVKNKNVIFTNLSNTGVIEKFLNFIGVHKSAYVVGASTVKTNGLGIATVKLTSTTPGFATIQVEVNKGAGIVRDKKTVYFTTTVGFATPPPPTLKLHVKDSKNDTYDEEDDYKLFKTADDNQRTIKAVLRDGYGRPLSGKSVTFGSDNPSEVTFQTANPAMTNTNGEAFVLIKVNPAIITDFTRVLNITAQYSEGSDSASDMLTLFLEPVTVSNISVTANPSVVAPNATSTIRATVYLNTGTPTPDGSTVNFTTTCGAVTPFAQTTSGVATATFTAPSIPPPGSNCYITASIGSVTSDPPTPVTVTTSLTVQPSAQTVSGATSGTATYTIYGGVSPYTATSNDAVIQPDITGNIMTVNFPPTASNKTITLTVRDSVAATATATLVITAAPGLSVFPSGTITVNNASDPSDITFTIFGGVAPYTVLSSNPVVYPPVLSDNTFTVTAPSVKNAPTETVVFMIRDSLGTTITVTMNIEAVAAQELKVIPTAQTIANPTVTPVASTASYTVIGGIAPYKAYSSSPALVTVPEDAAANTVQATVAGIPSIDTTVTITIYDSAGSSITASLILDVGSTRPLSVIPSTQSIANPTVTPVASTATFEILGGSGSGTYRAFSGNPGLVSVPSGFLSGNVLDATVEGVPSADTTVTITIYDTAGHSVVASLVLDLLPLAAVTVTPSAVAVTGLSNTDDEIPFFITGGTGTYVSVVSNNTAVIPNPTPTLAGNSFTIDPNPVVANTSVTLTVFDDEGHSGTSTVTVTPATSSLGINPSAILVDQAAGTITFNIIGGLPTYDVFTSDITIATVGGGPKIDDLATNTFNVQTVGPGSATITVVDSDGKTVTATVTIKELVPPVVSSTIPVNGATGVAPDSNITINWDENIDCSTVNTTNISIIPASTLTLFSCSGTQAVFTTSGQAASTAYTVTVSAAVTDLSGNPMATDYVFSYATAP